MNKAQDTKERIGRAAIGLIAGRGADAVSMRDIARIVGVTEAAIYRHFPGKDALVWEVFTTHYDIFAARLDAVQATHPKLNDKLTAMVGTCCEAFDTDRDLFTFLLLAQHIQRVRPQDYNAALPALLHSIISKAIENGEIPPQDVELSAAMVTGCVLQSAIYCLYHKDQPKTMSPLSTALSAACLRIVQGV